MSDFFDALGDFFGQFAHLKDSIQLNQMPVLKFLLIAASSCFVEDPARCIIGPLVGTGDIEFWFAVAGMTLGGFSGDFGLYLIGRFCQAMLSRKGWLNTSRRAWIRVTFTRHAVPALFFARFIPGSRAIVYMSGGVAKFPLLRLIPILLAAAFIQAVLYALFGAWIGEWIEPYLESRWTKWIVLAMAVLPIFIVSKVVARRTVRRNERKVATTAATEQK